MNRNWSEDAERIRELRPGHVLFTCVLNSSRSQMAAAIATALAPPSIRISSAGTRPAPIHPLAIEVLADLGFDLRDAPSRSIHEIPPDDVDVVITLCEENIGATFPGHALRVHWPLPDPSKVEGSDAARLDAFRQIRDELMRRLVVVFGGPRVQRGAA